MPKGRTTQARRLAAAALAGALAMPGALEAQEAQGPTIFVLDVSSSMTSSVDGATKMEHARAALGEMAEERAGGRDMGLVVYGAQNSQCDDIATIVSPGRRSAEDWRDALGNLSPRGATPIAASLRAALNASGADGPMSLVLIADGPESCRADPCAVAAELKEERENLAIHVIGFAASQPARLQPLSCIAEATGGQFAIARSRADLDEAIDAALGAGAPAQDEADAEAAQTAQAEASDAESNEEGETDGTAETVTAETDGEAGAEETEGERETAADGAGQAAPEAGESAMPFPRRPPADLVQLRLPSAPRIADVVGNGMQRLSVPPAATGFRAPGGDADTLASSNRPAPMPLAPRIDADMPHVPVSLAARMTESLPELDSGLVWRVYPASARENDDAGEPLHTSESASPTWQLRPGEYIVHVAYGRAQATKHIQVSLAPVRDEVVLEAGVLRLSAVFGDDKPVPAETVSFAVYDADPRRSNDAGLVVPRLGADEPVRLTEGQYHVVSRFGQANAMVRSNLRVERGKVTDAIVYHQAARITFKLVTTSGGEAIPDTRWTILTQDGDVVDEDVGAFPTTILAQGDYSLIAEHEGESFTRDFSVVDGADGEVEVLAAAP